MVEANAQEIPLVVGLVPAAGASRRMGQDKRLLPYRGATVLEITVRSLEQGGISPVVVILEPDSPCRRLEGLREVIIAVNPDPARGMLSSIREGLGRVPAQALAAAVLPGDHPFVPPTVNSSLRQAFLYRQPPLLSPRYGQRRGHPLFIHRDLFEEAARCDDRIGLRQLVTLHEPELVEVPFADPRAEDDLDRPEDLARLSREE